MTILKLIFIAAMFYILGAPSTISETIFEESIKANIDPATMGAIAYTETGGTWNPKAYNERSHTIGLFQIAPFWQRHFEVTKKELLNPQTNIKYGIKIYKHIKEQFSKRCTVYYSEWACNNVLTPLHFYRCTLKGANSRACHRSVGAVEYVKSNLKIEMRGYCGRI